MTDCDYDRKQFRPTWAQLRINRKPISGETRIEKQRNCTSKDSKAAGNARSGDSSALWLIRHAGRSCGHTRIDERAAHEDAIQLVGSRFITLADGHFLQTLAVSERHELALCAARYRHRRETVAALESLRLYLSETSGENDRCESAALEGALPYLRDRCRNIDTCKALALTEGGCRYLSEVLRQFHLSKGGASPEDSIAHLVDIIGQCG